MKKKQSSREVAIALTSGLIGALLALVVVLNTPSLFGQNPPGQSMTYGYYQPTNKGGAQELDADLNAALRENIVILMATARRVYDNDQYADDYQKALDDDTQYMGSIIKGVYGDGVEISYLQLWKNQDSYLLNYAQALRDNNGLAKQAALNNLSRYPQISGEFWAKTNPKLDGGLYKPVVEARITTLKEAIDAYAAKDIVSSYAKQHEAYNLVGKSADMLAEAIIRQFPERYK